ncbi:MAG: hypothetical protein JXA28_05595, partial [Bacteroidetes bacterium]|nr:hypothetical protein [Bacteroidota bacterium]
YTKTSGSFVVGNCPQAGTYTNTWIAEDECLNQSTVYTQLITIVDTKAPEWVTANLPSDFDVPCATDPIPFWDPKYGIDYDDNCDPNPTLVLVIDHDIIPQQDGTKLHIRSWRVDDACGNQSTVVTQTITELRCQFASLTQGFYGNSGGTWCANGYSTLNLLNNMLLTTDLTVGILSTASFTVGSGEGSCLIQWLPSGGTAAVLQSNDYGFNPNCSITPGNFSQTNNGKFYNILLGQTITFALNLRLDPNLLTDLELPTSTEPYMWTYASDYVNNICLDGNDVETGLPQYFYIPPAVITAVRTNYGSGLSDLLDFANDALAGGNTYNATLTEITMALDAYNRGFDGARFFAGYHTAPPPKAVVRQPLPEDFALHQNHPNPFNPSTTLSFTIPVECVVQLVIYNAFGEEVDVVLDRIVPAGTHAVVWNSQRAQSSLTSGVYTYRIRAVGPDGQEFHDVKKMMLVK